MDLEIVAKILVTLCGVGVVGVFVWAVKESFEFFEMFIDRQEK